MKKQNNISEDTLDLIQKMAIKPIPKWEFVLKNWLLWLAFGAAALIGGLGFSVVIFMMTSADWERYNASKETLAQVIVMNLPYFWLISSIGFAYFAYLSLRKTKKGYKYGLGKIVVTELILSLTCGILLYAGGIGEYIDKQFESNIPYYRQLAPMRLNNWMRPKEGFLAGKIIQVNSDSEFELLDFNNKTWKITRKDVVLRGGVTIKTGEEIKLIGSETGENMFEVIEIKPGKGARMHQGGCVLKENKGGSCINSR